MKPIIGITSSIDNKQHYLNRVYVDAIVRAGGVPFIIPTDKYIVQALDIIDGLLLSGGGDIDGCFFSQPTHKMATDIWPARDKAEITAARLVFARDMPILGICRGLQILNVALGGNILQHIDGHKQSQPRNVPTHSVKASGMLAEIMEMKKVMVNSIHHQVADRVADGLVVCGVAPDGIIEAICAPNKAFVLGVQWHPEELLYTHEHFRIFDAFVGAAFSRP